jgi:hypothetical protein
MKMLKAAAIFATALLTVASLHATVVNYSLSLSGPNESPANASPGIGTGTVTIDDVLKTMRVQIIGFSLLTGTTTAAHIHAATAVAFTGTAGVATTTPSFVGFPLGVTSGSYDSGTLDMLVSGSYNPAYVTANGGTTASAFAALKGAADAGKAYFNVHTTAFTGGEIRGFLTPIPEPTSAALLTIGAGMGLLHRRRNRRS